MSDDPRSFNYDRSKHLVWKATEAAAAREARERSAPKSTAQGTPPTSNKGDGLVNTLVVEQRMERTLVTLPSSSVSAFLSAHKKPRAIPTQHMSPIQRATAARARVVAARGKLIRNRKVARQESSDSSGCACSSDEEDAKPITFASRMLTLDTSSMTVSDRIIHILFVVGYLAFLILFASLVYFTMFVSQTWASMVAFGTALLS